MGRSIHHRPRLRRDELRNVATLESQAHPALKSFADHLATEDSRNLVAVVVDVDDLMLVEAQAAQHCYVQVVWGELAASAMRRTSSSVRRQMALALFARHAKRPPCTVSEQIIADFPSIA